MQRHGSRLCGAPLRAAPRPGHEKLRLLHPAPFRDEQRHRLRRLLQRLQIDEFVEAVHLAAAGAEAEARDAVVEAIEARIRECGEDEVLDRTAIDLVEGLAERGL